MCVAAEATAAPTATAAAVPPEERVGDRRFRLGLLGRFGFGGSFKLADEFSTVDLADFLNKGATLGFDIRFEWAPGKFVTAGLVLGNYWLLVDTEANRDYALDVSPFVKPRYPFKAGKKEAEAYLFMHFGGSMIVLDSQWDQLAGAGGVGLNSIGGGFNFTVAPGFQIFVSDSAIVIFEIGYSWSRFYIGASDGFTSTSINLTAGAATMRVGIARAF